MQQALEGVVWLGLDSGDSGSLVQGAALAYLFFAYGFWLAWLPWCGLRMRLNGALPPRRWMLQALLALGLVGGAALWVPLLLDASLFHPAVVHGSIAYNTTLLADRWINLGVGSTLYVVIIAAPLVISPSMRLRWFGAMILSAFLITHLAYGYAFTSVWCFFSAVFSITLYWIIREPEAVAVAVPQP
jgi:hypothetical protein